MRVEGYVIDEGLMNDLSTVAFFVKKLRLEREKERREQARARGGGGRERERERNCSRFFSKAGEQCEHPCKISF